MANPKKALLDKVLNARRESKTVEFKSKFDPQSDGAWHSLIKDIVAMANSGGGVIVIGVQDNGQPSGEDVSPVLSLDPAVITDKLHGFTGNQFADFEITEAKKEGHTIAVIVVNAAEYPVVFRKAGDTVFASNTTYFRHGAKSEPGNTEDLRQFIEKKVERIRKNLLDELRKVLEAPPGYIVTVLPPNVALSTSPQATPIRRTDDTSAPAIRFHFPDLEYPYRQKELIEEVNKRIAPKRINQYDILSVRTVYDITSKSEFYYKSRFGPGQYSQAFVDWLVEEYKQNAHFWEEARKLYRQATK